MQDFINTLRTLVKSTPEEIKEFAEATKEYNEAPKRQERVEARSGQNVKFPYGNTEMSEGYKNALTDAIKFYQSEFNVTPHVDIAYDPAWLNEEYGGEVAGVTLPPKASTGQSDVVLSNMSKKDENYMNQVMNLAESTGWSPKNAKDYAHVPVHEFGHAVYNMLFPHQPDEYNYSDGLYTDALKDMGIDLTKEHTSEDREKAANEVNKISGYASDELKYSDMPNTNEVIAESLSDYYYNRDEAAPLSKAIVRRLKSKGYMYGVNQMGGISPFVSGSTFMNNLRRYRVIQ